MKKNDSNNTSGIVAQDGSKITIKQNKTKTNNIFKISLYFVIGISICVILGYAYVKIIM